MKNLLQGFLLFSALAFVAVNVDADELNQRLGAHFTAHDTPKFIDYESISQSHSQDYGDVRYLVMAFEPLLASSDTMQRKIHNICSKVLNDVGLVTQLSLDGYDMVSVSFDTQSQYDCL